MGASSERLRATVHPARRGREDGARIAGMRGGAPCPAHRAEQRGERAEPPRRLGDAPQQRPHLRPPRLGFPRMAPIAKTPMALAPGRAALAAVHAADRTPAHCRLAARPMVVLAPRPAARRQPEVAPDPALPVARRQRFDTGHGVMCRLASSTVGVSRRAEGGEVQHPELAQGARLDEGQGGVHI